MAFQVIAPKQMRGFEIGRHRLEFMYQNPPVFAKVNRDDSLGRLKSDVGFAESTFGHGKKLDLLATIVHGRMCNGC